MRSPPKVIVERDPDTADAIIFTLTEETDDSASEMIQMCLMFVKAEMHRKPLTPETLHYATRRAQEAIDNLVQRGDLIWYPDRWTDNSRGAKKL